MTEKTKEEEELVPIGDGVEDLQPEPPQDEKPPKKSKSEEVEDEDDDFDDEDDEDEDDDDDERIGAGEDDGDDDEKRERRRQERKTRRQRQKEARERDKRELAFLQKRNEDLERKFSQLDARVGQSEIVQVDSRINDIKSKLKLADQVIAKAISSQDGEAYTEAQSIRDGLRDQLTRLTEYKTQYSSQREQPEVDPRLVSHAQRWMESHSWWDPNGGDEDSRRVSQLDGQLVREGHDPTTAEYWAELSRRVRKALPHKFSNGNTRADEDEGERGEKPRGKPATKKGPTFSSGGRERPLKKGEVYISPERRKAMEEAGVWDDPQLRQKYLRSYAKYDTEVATRK